MCSSFSLSAFLIKYSRISLCSTGYVSLVLFVIFILPIFPQVTIMVSLIQLKVSKYAFVKDHLKFEVIYLYYTILYLVILNYVICDEPLKPSKGCETVSTPSTLRVLYLKGGHSMSSPKLLLHL
ncbi:hypothetical protein DFOLPJBN_000137 [Candidatus Liberibacter asiaticus]